VLVQDVVYKSLSLQSHSFQMSHKWIITSTGITGMDISGTDTKVRQSGPCLNGRRWGAHLPYLGREAVGG